jgi:hypothetical protein
MNRPKSLAPSATGSFCVGGNYGPYGKLQTSIFFIKDVEKGITLVTKKQTFMGYENCRWTRMSTGN